MSSKVLVVEDEPIVLWNRDRVALVSVLDCLQIQQFLANNELAIDRL